MSNSTRSKVLESVLLHPVQRVVLTALVFVNDNLLLDTRNTNPSGITARLALAPAYPLIYITVIILLSC